MKRFLLGLVLLLSFGCFKQPATVVERVTSSIVRISATVEQRSPFGVFESPNVCTGFVVRPHVVMTAAHCVGKDMLGDGFKATLLKADQYFDLAVIRVPELNKTVLQIRDTEPTTGEEVVAIGYAWGWERPISMRLRVAMIAHSVGPLSVVGNIMQGTLIHGISGGPIIDESGVVIGVAQQTHDGTSYAVGPTVMRTELLDAGVN